MDNFEFFQSCDKNAAFGTWTELNSRRSRGRERKRLWNAENQVLTHRFLNLGVQLV